jgi:hypothetical protein
MDAPKLVPREVALGKLRRLDPQGSQPLRFVVQAFLEHVFGNLLGL